MEKVRNFLGHGSGATIMTSGSITGHLIRFALPLLVGNIFQQLYNTVDTWVVGNFVSNEAFSAVGSVGPAINTLIGFFSGLATGAGVVISQYYGAEKNDKVSEATHTAMVLTFILSAIFTVAGILLIPLMLNVMNTPPEVRPDATKYLTIYFAGVTGLLVYNIGAGILRAIGDSRHPFYFLVFSALLNTGLDLLFVIQFEMKVEGVAYATIISQGISAILILLVFFRTHSPVRLYLKEMKIHKDSLKRIFKIGFPAGFQMAITSFSNVFVQSYINQFGPDVMSGWTAYGKVDQLIALPTQSLAMAATTFVGQNMGAGNMERAKKGGRHALFLSIITMIVLMVPVLVFAPQITSFFNSKNEVIYYGSLLLRWMSPFYLITCYHSIYIGILRGAGNSKVPMILNLASFVIFRQIYLFIMSNYICNELIPLALSYPAGWLVCSVSMFIYYRKVNLFKTRIVD